MGPWIHRNSSNAEVWFTDGLNPNGVHWVAVATQPHHQLYRMKNECGSTYWADLQVILIALTNTHFD